MKTSNLRIKAIDPIISPHALIKRYPANEQTLHFINGVREAISDIIHKRSHRFLVVVGPCSVHDVDAAIEYAERLTKLREKHHKVLEIVMRVYFEKPRTTVGWKGLINDPDLNNTFNVDKGLDVARRLLLTLNEMGIPAGSEFLDAVTGQYYADLISWGAIGARTTESQIHRELASGISCPIGFKNGTNGNIDIAADAVLAARSEHSFLSPTEQGTTALFTTAGNDDAHVILRGGKQPNYDATSVLQASEALAKRNIDTGLMVDFSHANSQKQHRNQIKVADDVAQQIAKGSREIIGCMIESHLVEGRQDAKPGVGLTYGQSITDACVDFEATESIIDGLAKAIDNGRLA